MLLPDLFSKSKQGDLPLSDMRNGSRGNWKSGNLSVCSQEIFLSDNPSGTRELLRASEVSKKSNLHFHVLVFSTVNHGHKTLLQLASAVTPDLTDTKKDLLLERGS